MVRGWEAVDISISLVIFVSGYFESGTNFPWYEEVQKIDEHKRFGNDSKLLVPAQLQNFQF